MYEIHHGCDYSTVCYYCLRAVGTITQHTCFFVVYVIRRSTAQTRTTLSHLWNFPASSTLQNAIQKTPTLKKSDHRYA